MSNVILRHEDSTLERPGGLEVIERDGKHYLRSTPENTRGFLETMYDIVSPWFQKAYGQSDLEDTNPWRKEKYYGPGGLGSKRHLDT